MNFGEARTELMARGFDYLSPGRLTIMLNNAKNALEDQWAGRGWRLTRTGKAPLAVPGLKHVYYVQDTDARPSCSGSICARSRSRPHRDQPARPSTGGSTAQVAARSSRSTPGPPRPRSPAGARLVVDSPELSADTDTPLIPKRYHPLWIDFAVIEAYKDCDNLIGAQTLRGDIALRVQDLILRYEARNLQHSNLNRRTHVLRGRVAWPPRYTAGYRPYAFGDFSRRPEPARQGRHGRRPRSDRPAQRHVHPARRDAPTRRLHRLHGRPAPARRQPLAVLHGRRAAPTDRRLRHPPGRPGHDRRDRRVPDRDGRRAVDVRALRRPDARVSLRRQRLEPAAALERHRVGGGGALADRQRDRRPGDATGRLDRRHRVDAGHHVRHERLEPAGRHRRSAPRPRPGRAARQSTPSRVYFSNAGQPEIWETDGFVGPARAADATSSTSRPATASRSSPRSPGASSSSSSRRRSSSSSGVRASAPTATRPSRSARSSTTSGCAPSSASTVGRDGVYFFNRRGVYRTTGEDPVLLSDIIARSGPVTPRSTTRASRSTSRSSGSSGLLVHGAAVRRDPDRVERVQRPAAALRHPAQLVDRVRHPRLRARPVPPARSDRAASRRQLRPDPRRAPQLRLHHGPRAADHVHAGAQAGLTTRARRRRRSANRKSGEPARCRSASRSTSSAP